MKGKTVLLLALSVSGCQVRSNQRPPSSGAARVPPANAWAPAPDAVYFARRPPPLHSSAPLSVGGQITNESAVRSAFVPVGSCLPRFSKNSTGVCVSDVAQSLPAQSPTRPTDATVLVESALLNAKKFGDRCWDPGCNEDQTRDAFQRCAKIASLLDPTDKLYYDALAVLGPMALGVWSNPDTYGHASIFSNGAYSPPVTLTVDRNKDSLTPQWGVQFTHVSLSPSSALRLEFWDADPDIPLTNGDDSMGIVTISGDELLKAAQERRTHSVNVAKQTNDQVLFVNISVLPEG